MKTLEQIQHRIRALERVNLKTPKWSAIKDEDGNRLRDPISEMLEYELKALNWVVGDKP